MLPSAESVPVEQLRQALRLRIAESSFRVIAGEIGMSPSGLHTFLGGTSPHYSTIRKVTAWYVREAHRAPDAASLGALGAALELLVQHLPGPAHPTAINEILDLVRAQSDRSRTPVPDWVDLLSARDARRERR